MNRDRAIDQIASALKSRDDIRIQDAFMQLGGVAKIERKTVDYRKTAEEMLDAEINRMAVANILTHLKV